jgi:hypothetical protein
MRNSKSDKPSGQDLQTLFETEHRMAAKLSEPLKRMQALLEGPTAQIASKVKLLGDFAAPAALTEALNSKFDALNSIARSVPNISVPNIAELEDQLSKVRIDSLSWRDRWDEVANTPIPVGPSPMVEAAVETRQEVRRVAEILVTTSEQIGALATVAQAALAPLPRLEELSRSMLEESGKLRGVVEQGQQQADRSSKRMTWLTIGIFALTLGILLLTGVLAFGIHLSLPSR